MPFLIYFFVLLITAGSVVFGLDWASAPMSPMPAARPVLHAAVKRTPPRAETVVAKTAPSPVQAVSQPAPLSEPAAAPAPSAFVSEPAKPAVPVAAASPKCDVDACTSAYRSFRAEDCTYQPSNGPRRFCAKGAPQEASADAAPTPDARAQAACNIAACSQAYHSFTSADCSYQPTFGPRRICEK